METNKKNLKRILWLSDFACSTGFATVSHNIIQQLLKTEKYQIDVIAINYYGMPNEWQRLYPLVRIFPSAAISNGDVFGRQGVLNMLATGGYDLLFTLQDTFQMELVAGMIVQMQNLLKEKGKPFEWVYYYPIDAKPKESWIKNCVALCDNPVAYTEYGQNETLKHADISNLINIPHGYDPSVFFPVEDSVKEKFRKEYFDGKAEGKYIITNVNRNQPRKDFARTLQIFSNFKKKVPNSILYLHCKETDLGGSINEMAKNFGLIEGEDYILPKNFSEGTGISLTNLNMIYNVSDVIMTTTLGEGWGLSMTEAMGTKTPVIAPNHTSLTEMLEGRGTLVGCGKTSMDWVSLQNDNDRLRPLADVDEYVEKLVNLINDKEHTKELADKAFKYASENLTWEVVCKKWIAIFDKLLSKGKKVYYPLKVLKQDVVN
jgi:D-inositol-3-phosphate glycosyltransferase